MASKRPPQRKTDTRDSPPAVAVFPASAANPAAGRTAPLSDGCGGLPEPSAFNLHPPLPTVLQSRTPQAVAGGYGLRRAEKTHSQQRRCRNDSVASERTIHSEVFSESGCSPADPADYPTCLRHSGSHLLLHPPGNTGGTAGPRRRRHFTSFSGNPHLAGVFLSGSLYNVPGHP